jgi:Rne/Rng family ribonuclease
MKNEIFVNVGPRETRVAVRETDRVVELHIERAAERGVVGGIYKGRVTRVLPGMQAAFVDIGLERGGFLYVADYRADIDDDDDDESPSPAPSRRRGAAQRGQGPQIEDLLEEGREILVQVKKEPLGTKGARIESRISLAGRHLVLMPGASRVGVSRRIAGDRERRRLRKIVDDLRPADQDLGFIVRTVSHGVSEADIKADIDYLVSRWEQVQKRTAEVTEVPALIYEEPPLHIRILRDLVTHETKQIVVDDAAAYGEMQEFVKKFMAAPRPRIVNYTGDDSLFDAERIEPQIDEGVSHKVWLKSGGHLVIDHRREHRRLRGRQEPESRGDHPQDQPRGGARDRPPGPLPEHRRPADPRPDRHGSVRESGKGLPRAGRRDARGQGQGQPAQDLGAGPDRDDAQAHAREPDAAALRSLSDLRGQGLPALAEDAVPQDLPRAAQGRALSHG